MNKFVRGFILIITIAIVSYYGYTSYKKLDSFIGVVHENADSVIKVGVHDIMKTIAWDAITSPKYYYDNSNDKKDDDDKEKDDMDEGITIPYNAFIYSLPEIADTYFTTLEIYDVSEFERFIKKELDKKTLKIQDAEDKSYRFALIKDLKTQLAWNEEKLIVTTSFNSSFEKAKQVYLDILVHAKTIKDSDHELLKALKNEASHITYADAKSTTNLDFNDGIAYLKGITNDEAAEKYPNEVAVAMNSDASLSLYFDVDFKQNIFKERFIKSLELSTFFKKNNLDASKLADRTNGFFSIEVNGKTTQQDTIVTYEYDDNFEKIETKTLQEKEVPKINIKLGAENESLKTYLSEIEVLDKNNVFTPFPLYQLQVQEDAMYTYFSTYSELVVTQKKINSNFFEGKVNFEKLQKDIEIPQTTKLFALLEHLRIRGYVDNNHKINTEGSLTGKNPEVNILSQLFFGMDTNESTQKEETEL